MALALQTRIELGDDQFTVTGPQLDSAALVRMECRYRGDGQPARFSFCGTTIPATVDYLCREEERGLTTIGTAGLEIRQVEHILSALLGMNCLSTDIHLSYQDTPEGSKRIAPPVCHLNSEDFAIAARRAFSPRQPNKPLTIGKALLVTEESPASANDPSYALIAPLQCLSVTGHINFPTFWGQQLYSCTVDPNTYQDSITWARSFFSTPYPHNEEWKILQARYPALLRERVEHARSILIDYDTQRWITPIRAIDEPVRHKILDFIGDLALLGVSLQAGIYVYKPHHRFNRQCIRAIRDALV